MNLNPQSFEGTRKILKGMWLSLPAYMVLTFAMPAIVVLALILAILHIAEIPLALLALRKNKAPLAEKISNTFLYGFTYWLPKSLEPTPA